MLLSPLSQALHPPFRSLSFVSICLSPFLHRCSPFLLLSLPSFAFPSDFSPLSRLAVYPSLSFRPLSFLLASLASLLVSASFSSHPSDRRPRHDQAVTSLSWGAILPSDNQGPPLSSLYTAASPPGFSDPPAGSPARILLLASRVPLATSEFAGTQINEITQGFSTLSTLTLPARPPPPFRRIAASFVNVDVVTTRKTTGQRKLRNTRRRFSAK